ncbi:hypothetical protein DSM112329_01037 [Paraconexibacter sp. AEG42_29]|uniref:Lipoprotein n=1 Tax=Paraconexibacter sp. AEG42_29 TaxID=2997339 RepID=A0AAU7ARB5_9ACTN
MFAPRAALLTLTIAGLAAVAGCGGSDSDKEKTEVEKVARAVLNGADKGSECRLSTTRLVTAVWGSQSACLKASTGGTEADVTVSGTKVDGSDATANITTTIDKLKVEGSLALKKVEGDWKLDEFGTDLVRSLLRGSLTKGYTDALKEEGIAGADKLLTDGATENCVDKRLTALPASEQRQIGYAIFGNRKDSPQGQQVQGLLIECLADSPDGREALRLAFEQGIKEEGLGDKVTACVIARLRETADSELVAKEIVERQKNGGAISPELSGLAAAAVKRCKASQPS